MSRRKCPIEKQLRLIEGKPDLHFKPDTFARTFASHARRLLLRSRVNPFLHSVSNTNEKRFKTRSKIQREHPFKSSNVLVRAEAPERGLSKPDDGSFFHFCGFQTVAAVHTTGSLGLQARRPSRRRAALLR